MRKCRRVLSRVNSIENLEPRRLLSRALGIDVSSYQGAITKASWTTYKNSDSIIYAWTKATEGVNFEDADFVNNMSTAAAAGVEIGPYDFARYDSHQGTSGADTEAAYFWSVVSSYYTSANATKKEYLMPMLDMENEKAGAPGTWGYTTTTLSAWVNEWCSDIVSDGAAVGVVLQPIIYTGSSFASSWLNTGVAQKWADWIANYGSAGGAITKADALSENLSSTGPWSGYWEAWQYSDTGTDSGGTGAPGDQDVLNGDATDLQNLVFGSGKYAAGSSMETTGSVTATANSDGSGTASNVAGGVVGTVLGTPKYRSENWYFDVQFSTGVTGWVPETSLEVPTSPSVPTIVSPANNTTVYTIPTFTWNTDAGAATYNLYLNNSLYASNLTDTSYTPGSFAAGNYTWYIQAKNSTGTNNSASAAFTYKLPIPTAVYASQLPITGSSVLNFSVGYSDPTVSIDTSTFDSNDVTVTGPNGYSQTGTFISQSQPGNGPSRNATYQIPAPNGIWNVLANGTYTVTLNANQVADTSGSYVVGGTLGTFTVNAPFAYTNSSGQLVINTTASNPNISMYKSGSLWNVSNGSSNDQFNPAGFSSVDLVGTSGNDSLSISSALTVPLSFNGGAGQDSLTVLAGTLTFASDLSTTTSALTLSLYGTAQVNFSSSQHLAGLDLYNNSVVSLAPGAGIALETQDLEINSSGYVDIADNALVVYGSDPDTMSYYLQTGLNGGTWDGTGGINSHVAAANIGNTVGFAPASSLSYSSINGVSFSTTAIVVRYTYEGDANLDGTVNGDDLSVLALSMAQEQTAKSNNQPAPAVYWYTGDNNYDGQVDSDDLMLLSLGSAKQNQQVLA